VKNDASCNDPLGRRCHRLRAIVEGSVLR